MTLWPLASSPWITIIGWMGVAIYFLVAITIIIVLFGIQLVRGTVSHLTNASFSHSISSRNNFD